MFCRVNQISISPAVCVLPLGLTVSNKLEPLALDVSCSRSGVPKLRPGGSPLLPFKGHWPLAIKISQFVAYKQKSLAISALDAELTALTMILDV